MQTLILFLSIPPYASDRMFQRFRGIQVQEVFSLNYFHDMGITVGLTGQVGKIVDLLSGTNAQLIG